MADGTFEGLRITVVGAGAVASALVADVEREGKRARLRVAARRRDAASALVERTGGRGEATGPEGALADADVVLVAVRDDALESVARTLAAHGGTPAPGAVILHTSGFRDDDALAALGEEGSLGSMHPLRSLPPVAGEPGTLAGAFVALSGEDRARTVGQRLVHAFDARPLLIASGHRARYHAAATLLAGGTAALFDHALGALSAAAEDDEPVLRAALADLLASTAEALAAAPAADALTGAVARGDAKVVKGHLDALASSPATLALYVSLAERMLELARRGRRARSSDLDAIAALLESGPGAP